MRPPLLALTLTAAAVAATTAAQAADPGEGKVSAASPTVSWKGLVASAGVSQNAWNQDPAAPCDAPACDTFTLEVADQANLQLKLKGFRENTAGGDPTCSIRVTAPDGKQTHNTGPCGPKTEMKVTIKNAAKGKYVLDIANSHVVNTSGPENYEASATLVVPPPAVSPPPSGGPAPAPTTTAPPAQQQPAAATLTAKAPKLSARKLKKAKKFTVKLTSSAPLTGVNGILVNKKKQVGGGRLASLNGSGKLVVKLKKLLKNGSYQLSVGGRDAQGRNAVVAIKLKIKK
jgi:hypothetical protein